MSGTAWFVAGFVTCLAVQLLFICVLLARGSRPAKKEEET